MPSTAARDDIVPGLVRSVTRTLVETATRPPNPCLSSTGERVDGTSRRPSPRGLVTGRCGLRSAGTRACHCVATGRGDPLGELEASECSPKPSLNSRRPRSLVAHPSAPAKAEGGPIGPPLLLMPWSTQANNAAFCDWNSWSVSLPASCRRDSFSSWSAAETLEPATERM